MKIAFNPSTVAALTTPPNNKDITFDLRGHNIFARGVKFYGTDTNTWRDIKVNNVSIGSHTLDLRNGSNTTLTNTNGVVTINSTWRPVVDSLTSDSTTSSLSAKQGKVLKALIDGKSNLGHTHDDRYLKLTGGTMNGNAIITFADSGSWNTGEGPQGARGGLYWTGQSDYAKLYAEETAGDNLDLVIQFGDDNSNGLSIRNKTNTQTSYISAGGVITTGTFKGNLDWSYITNKPSSYTPSAHNHDGRYLRLDGSDTMTGIFKAKANQYNDGYDGAINMNNSDIYGLNSIYTSDKSDSQAEGIHFWRDSTHVDTLRMMDGKLLFTSNRPLGGSGTEQTVLHTGNSYIKGGVITINGSSITPLTSLPSHTHSWDSITGKPSSFTPSTHTHGLSNSVFFLNMPNISGNATWKEAFGYPVNYNLLLSVRINSPAPEWCVGNYGSGILYGGSDTKGFMSSAYNEPLIMWAGGNGSSNDSVPKWYIGIRGTHKSIYNLTTIASEANAAYNLRHSHANKSVLDGITSGLVNNWNTAYTFVNTITGTDTDKVINKWDEIVNFLAGITEDNKLNTLLNSKLSIQLLSAKEVLTTKTNNALFWVNTVGTAGSITTGPFTDHPYALLSITNYSQNNADGKFFYRSRLAFSSTGDIKVASCHHQGEYKLDETWYNVLTSKNSGIDGSTIKLNGTSITVYSSGTADGRYVKKSGDTMTGALNFANVTWNKVGDDIYMGDHNIGGQLCLMGITGNTGISFHKLGDASIRKSITFNGSTLYMNGNCDYASLANLSNLLAMNTVPNKTTSTSVGSWSPISGRYVFHQRWRDTSTGSDGADFGIYLDGDLTANMVLDGYYNSLLGFRVIGATGGFLKANGTIDHNTYLTSHQSLSNYYTKGEINTKLNNYLPLSGGTMKGLISSAYSVGTWIGGCTNAIIKAIADGYNSLICAPIKSGNICISAWTAEDNLNFGYAKKGKTENAFDTRMYWDAPNNNLHATAFTGHLYGTADNAVNADTTDGVHLEWAGELGVNDYTWLAGWTNDGKKIKAVNKNLFATSGHNHDNRYVRAFGTSNDNIDSDWGQSFKTFDPIPSGTPPELNPNISLLSIGNNFNRRKLLAFIYSSDNIYYRRHIDGSFTNWRRLAFANEIPTSLKNPASLNTFGVVYDGSAAKTVTTSTFIGLVSEATSTITDGTMLITSWASNNGFADPNAVNVPYKRKAVHLWEYIKGKTDSLYATKSHNHDGRYVYNYGGTAANGQTLNQNALFMSTTSGITGDWWHILQAAWNDEYRWNSLIAFPTLNRNGMYYRSGLDDNTKWGSWVKLLDVNNYPSTLDSRYYTESEVNNLLSKKLDRVNLSTGSWNPRGYSLAADYHYNGGDLSISENGGKMYVSIDGYFWLNEGLYRVLDTSDVAELKGNLTVYLYLSNTDTAWYPLIWGGSAHNNTNNSTGEIYKSHDKLSWLTSSLTLYATKLLSESLTTGSALFVPGTIKDATLKIYSGRTTDAVDDGHIGLLTSIDSTDGETHTYPTLYGSRCVLALLPRGGSVYIGNMPNGGNGRKLNVNGDIGLFNVGSIRDLTIGGGIYWNPYVESATDGSDAASITLVRLGVAGGTTLVLSLMNDANDTILFKTNGSARLYHNSYPILTTLNTYVSNNKGYINNTEITLVNNATNATKANKIVNWYSTRPTSLNAQFGDGSLRIFYATSSTTEGKSPGDAAVLHLAWDNNGGWDSQLAISSPSSRVYSRSQNGGTWQPWKTLAFTTDIPSSLKNPHLLTLKANGTTLAIYDGSSAKEANFTYTNVGAASASHTHSYYAVNENYGGFKKAERLPISGFYQSVESESGGNAPWSSWMHLINCLHNNTNNNYALLIAASFYDNSTFKIRVTNNNVNNAWRDIIHSGNINSQSVASASKLQTARNIWGQSFDGTTNVDNTLRIRKTTGNYCEGIRIQTGDGAWSTIILGATSDSGTNTNAWSIHRKSDNNFAISRNSSDGTNGLVMTSVGMGLGTTSPTQRLDVNGNIRTTGNLYISHATNNNMNHDTSNPRIVFSDSGSLAVGLVYTNYNSYRASKGLKVMDVDNDDAGNVWFEVLGYNYSSGYVKNGSNDNYVLLGGGGHKAISDFMLKTDELSNNLTTISKSLIVTQAWMDTGIKYTDLPANGTYIIQVSASNPTDYIWANYWSGIMSWYREGTNDSETDEIILHRAGRAYHHTIYLRTIMTASSDGRHLRLQIAADTNLSTAVTYTFKFKRVI